MTSRLASATRHCSFCGQMQKEVSTLVTGPTVAICNGCVALAEEFDESVGSISNEFTTLTKTRAAAECSFCSKDDRPLILQAGDAFICTECLEVSRKIIRESFQPQHV